MKHPTDEKEPDPVPPQPEAGKPQPVAEIDVLARRERGVETADALERGALDGEVAAAKPRHVLTAHRARAHLLVTVPLYMRFDPSAGPPEPPRRPGTGQ